MAGISVSVTFPDGPDITRALESLEPSVAKRIISGPLRKFGRKILEEADWLVPEDTGELARSLRQRKTKHRQGSYGVAVGTAAKRIEGFFHAAPVDLGFTRVGGSHVEPVEFLEQAFDLHVKSAQEEIPREMWKAIEKSWAKQARAFAKANT